MPRPFRTPLKVALIFMIATLVGVSVRSPSLPELVAVTLPAWMTYQLMETVVARRRSKSG